MKRIKLAGAWVDRAAKGDTVAIEVRGAADGDRVYKTFSSELKVELGADLELKERSVPSGKFELPVVEEKWVDGPPELFVKVHSIDGAREADASGASVIYFDIFKEDIESVRDAVGNARFFVSTPRVMADEEVERACGMVERLKPDGVLAGERGLHSMLKKANLPVDIHLDSSFNVFNDLDIAAYAGIPVVSPELTLEELAAFRSKRFIVMAHGPLVLMTTREPLKEGALCDEDGRKFRVRKAGALTEVLNCSELGLFNKTRDLLDAGMKWFFLDLERNVGKTIGTYRKILAGRPFNDKRIRHGFTTGHFGRGVE